MFPRARSRMNCTGKLLALALAAVAFLSLDFHAQSTLPKGSKLSLESVGVCRFKPFEQKSSRAGEPYDVAEAYQVYSALIPTVAPNPEANMWFIRIDTSPIGRGSSLSAEDAKQWKKARGADTA